jgi:hypothetical protein
MFVAGKRISAPQYYNSISRLRQRVEHRLFQCNRVLDTSLLENVTEICSAQEMKFFEKVWTKGHKIVATVPV